MIRKYTISLIFIFLISCGGVDLVLKDIDRKNQLKNNTWLLLTGDTNEDFSRELYSFFGNNKKYDYILSVAFLEKKENRIVKTNQVAEKVEYTLEISYNLFYKTNECKIFNKKIISNFSITPKSAGYNFGTDRSFEKLYTNTVRKNINNFINLGPFNNDCLQ